VQCQQTEQHQRLNRDLPAKHEYKSTSTAKSAVILNRKFNNTEVLKQQHDFIGQITTKQILSNKSQ